MTKFIAMIAINLVMPKAAAKPYPLLNWGTRKLMRDNLKLFEPSFQL